MPDRRYNVLFLCTGNSARSIIAEAILGKVGSGKFNAYSAGSQPKGTPHPQTITLLSSLGHDTSKFRSKSWNEFAQPGAPALDFVFTVCDNAAGETCPFWPAQPMTAHWGVPDPAAATGNAAEIALAFKDAYRMLHQRIAIFAALPLDSLDAMSLQAKLRDIGRMEGDHQDARTELTIAKRLTAEALGTAFLLATVVGSGIMAERLAGGNAAIALLGNTLPTGAILVVLILIFAPLSGAHFNPAVSLVFALRGELTWRDFALYVAVQIVAAVIGVLIAHAMFDLPLWQVSTKVRAGFSQQLAEFVAAFGLVLTILGCIARAPAAVAYAVGLYITAAYWFTASTSFANPAVTIARSLSDTFAGIAPAGVLAFVTAQLLGAAAALLVARFLYREASLERG